jgi:hypothetical protein
MRPAPPAGARVCVARVPRRGVAFGRGGVDEVV